MAKSVYIYGPAGCGKTHHTEEFKRYFNVGNVVDDFYGGSREVIPLQGFLVLGESRVAAPPGVRVLHYDSACAMAGISK